MAEPEGDRWGNLAGNMRGVLPAGTSLRGYELIAILGQGAFGITYRARDLQLHREVAIKEYLPTSLALREGRTTVVPRSLEHAEQFAWGRERFLDEARTLARLDRTPAIVRVHDFLEDNGTAYMVMALIEGETLARRLAREQRLQPDAVERLVFPLLDGLEEVHGIGFLHRDIKPANIMMDAHGRPTLIDFGASRAAMAERSTTLTAIFTPGYAAAEQFTSATLGPWSDIYGLAATLYHAVTGRIPPSAIDRILNDTYEPLSTLQPEGFPAGLLAGIDAGLAIRVEDRPATVAEWRQMLRSDGYGVASSEATRVARRPGRLARAAGRTRRARLTLKGPALWGSLAATIVLLAGGGYLAVNSFWPGTGTGPSIASLSAEQLEQALVERRKADALAAEKRRLEDEARQKAQAEAEAKRQADAELDQARQARLKAEQELADLKAVIEARRNVDPNPRDHEAMAAQRAFEESAQRKAEQEAATLREAEDEAAKKAAADAEAKRQADQVLAEAEAQRRRAEEEARTKAAAETTARAQATQEEQRKAEQETAARRQADEAQAKAQAEREKAEADARIKAQAQAEADKAAASLAKIREEDETAEKTSKLEPADRQRLQVALTSLGFDTRGIDGLFGPRTRDMITSWQKARSQPATGFLTAAQQQALTKEAAAALSKYDAQKKAEEEASARTVASASIGPTAGLAPADGLWRGSFECGRDGTFRQFTIALELRLTNGSGTWTPRGGSYANDHTRSIDIQVAGPNITAKRDGGNAGSLNPSNTPITGRYEGNSIRASNGICTLALTRDGAPTGAAAAVLPDGTYSGALQIGNWLLRITMQFANGVGSGIMSRPDCGAAPISLRVDPAGNATGEGRLVIGSSCAPSLASITGRVEGGRLILNAVAAGGGAGSVRREFVLSPGGADPSESTTAAAQPPSRSALSTFDGTYSGETSKLSAGLPGAYVVLRVRDGLASGSVDVAGCTSSTFTATVSASGSVTGEGEANCVFGNQANGLAPGPFQVTGDYKGNHFALGLDGSRRGFRVVLRPGGPATPRAPGIASPPTPRSPDGLWRGTYACEAGVGGINAGPILLNVEMRLENGAGSWKPSGGVTGFTLELRVRVDGSAVTVMRFFAGGGASISSHSSELSGQFNGQTLSAEGRELGLGNRECKLSLVRA